MTGASGREPSPLAALDNSAEAPVPGERHNTWQRERGNSYLLLTLF